MTGVPEGVQVLGECIDTAEKSPELNKSLIFALGKAQGMEKTSSAWNEHID